jgi:hypothetical protein
MGQKLRLGASVDFTNAVYQLPFALCQQLLEAKAY